MDTPQLVELLILAAIASFLVYRLSRVLGERNGSEPQLDQNPLDAETLRRQAAIIAKEIKRQTGQTVQSVTVTPVPKLVPVNGDEPLSINQGLQQIQQFDPSFNERAFLSGARAAFELIIKAYARGDADALKSLLSPDLQEKFQADIQSRIAQNLTMETIIHQLREVEILSVRMRGFDAEIVVQFISDQTSYVLDAAGEVVAGRRNEIEDVTDQWTFRRDVRTRDPAWLLVAASDA